MLFVTFLSLAHAAPHPFAGLFGPTPLSRDDDTGVLVTLPPEVGEGIAIQTWLSRTAFQPGSIDGRPGDNTENALRAFQEAQGLDATGEADKKTRAVLRKAAKASRRSLLRRHVVTEKDIEGPYVKLPEGLYAAHESPCMCYESAWEELAEQFQVSQDLLVTLNPEVNRDTVKAGVELVVPDVQPVSPLGKVTRIEIHVQDRTLTALDAEGRLLRQYPTVIGETFAQYRGEMTVVNVARNPVYHLDPTMWDEMPDTLPEVVIPPGPNSPVGVVWMGLSKDGYGIHGTSHPDTIGHTESHGCVRLTNWSAIELADHVEPDVTRVDFVGIQPD